MKAPPGFINIRRVSEEGHKKVVYTAYHLLTQSWMVLKEFRESPTEEALAEDLRPFLWRLDHENIVRQEQPQIVNGSIWVIEERLDGTFQDLAPMDDQYAFSVLASHIAHAVSYLHHEVKDRPIVHGDIHLRNCGLVNGVGKLLDFGQATYDDEHNPRQIGHGYICTRAPEQFTEKVTASKAIDVWALGCTLFALRAGEYPFITAAELEEYREAQRLKDDARIASIEQEVSRRSENGLDGEVPARFREQFDDQIWSILRMTMPPKGAPRADIQEVDQALDEYVETSQTALKPAEVDSEVVIRHAKELVATNRVARVTWFENAIGAKE
jgi:serine/threonine protein kinase